MNKKKKEKEKSEGGQAGKNLICQRCMDVEAEYTDVLFSSISLDGKQVGKIRQI